MSASCRVCVRARPVESRPNYLDHAEGAHVLLAGSDPVRPADT